MLQSAVVFALIFAVFGESYFMHSQSPMDGSVVGKTFISYVIFMSLVAMVNMQLLLDANMSSWLFYCSAALSVLVAMFTMLTYSVFYVGSDYFVLIWVMSEPAVWATWTLALIVTLLPGWFWRAARFNFCPRDYERFQAGGMYHKDIYSNKKKDIEMSVKGNEDHHYTRL